MLARHGKGVINKWRVLPEFWHKLRVCPKPLHILSAALIHLSQDIEPPQPHHQLHQQQVTAFVLQHFTYQRLPRGRRAVIQFQRPAQVKESPAFVAAQGLCYLVDCPELIR